MNVYRYNLKINVYTHNLNLQQCKSKTCDVLVQKAYLYCILFFTGASEKKFVYAFLVLNTLFALQINNIRMSFHLPLPTYLFFPEYCSQQRKYLKGSEVQLSLKYITLSLPWGALTARRYSCPPLCYTLSLQCSKTTTDKEMEQNLSCGKRSPSIKPQDQVLKYLIF